jgi:hypothetical protein
MTCSGQSRGTHVIVPVVRQADFAVFTLRASSCAVVHAGDGTSQAGTILAWSHFRSATWPRVALRAKKDSVKGLSTRCSSTPAGCRDIRFCRERLILT